MSDQLPTPTQADGAGLLEAHRTGRAEMCRVDEAEIRAIGFTPVTRGEGRPAFPAALAPVDDPVVVAAGQRLVSRGLATDRPTSRSAVTADGPLLAWFVGHVLPANQSLVVNVQRTPLDDVASQRQRVTVVAGSGMTMVEYLTVPLDAGDRPLPVGIDAVRSDVWVEELLAEAFAPVAPGGTLTLDLVTTAAHGPARFVADHETAGLSTRGHGLLRKATRLSRQTPESLRAHLQDVLGELGS